ncbi:MAG: hypothetical protein Q9182_002888 [Xanthomendoza sp. 2 TL-2023]
MLTPVAVTDGPFPTVAGSITQHIPWTAPTQPASPGSVGVPDAPRPTSGATSAHSTATNDGSHSVTGSKTKSYSGLPLTNDYQVPSLPPSSAALVSTGHITPLAPKPGDWPQLTINGETILPDNQSRVNNDHEELPAAGPTVTIRSTPYALAPSSTALVTGSSTIGIQQQGVIVNEDSTAPNLRGVYKTPQHTGLALVIGSATSTLDPSAQDQPPIITVNSIRYTIDLSSVFTIGSQTLAPGSPAITINSTAYSLHQVAPLRTLAAPPPSPNASLPTAGEAVVTVASRVYTCHQNTPCTIASQILKPNGSITVGAEKVVYGEGGIDVVRESKVVVTPSRGEVKTSHISGLTPIGEETGTAPAPAPGRGDAESGGGKDKALIRRKWMVMGVVAGMVVGWCCG